MNDEIYITKDYFNELEKEVFGLLAYYTKQQPIYFGASFVKDLVDPNTVIHQHTNNAEIMIGNKSI